MASLDLHVRRIFGVALGECPPRCFSGPEARSGGRSKLELPSRGLAMRPVFGVVDRPGRAELDRTGSGLESG